MGKRVALVLGSGGARGYAHIGVIEELEARGYQIACIAGSSMGAVVGGIYAAGKLPVYRRWVETLDYLDVLRLLDVSFSLGAIRGEPTVARPSAGALAAAVGLARAGSADLVAEAVLDAAGAGVDALAGALALLAGGGAVRFSVFAAADLTLRGVSGDCALVAMP